VIAQSVQRCATGWMIRVLEFDSRWGLRIFLFTTASRPALGPTHPPIQWVPGALSLGVKNGRGVKLITHLHLVPRSKNAWSYTSTSTSTPILLHGVMLSLKKAQGQINLYLYIYSVRNSMTELCQHSEKF
jgi:hypothetical protein